MTELLHTPLPFGSAAVRICAGALALASGAAAQTSGAAFGASTATDLSASQPMDLAFADFDADGRLDAVVALSVGSEASVLLGDGAGGWSSVDELPAGGAYAVVAADFTGDGRPDLAFGYGGHDTTLVQVFRGDGAGGFALHASLTAGKFPISLAASDFDGDGDIDLACANNVLYGATVFANGGTGSFAAGQHVPGLASTMATDLRCGDLDGDGKPELALAHYNGVAILHNNGMGAFSSSGSAGLGVLTEDVELADLNLDGALDAASTAIYSDLLVSSLSQGGGSFALYAQTPTGSMPRGLDLADVNADGAPDAAIATSGAVAVHPGRGDGGWLARQDFAMGLQPWDAGLADLDGDARSELCAVLRNLGDTPALSVRKNLGVAQPWHNEGHPKPAAAGWPLLTGSGPLSAGAAFALALAHGRPNAAVFLVVGHGAWNLPLLGGTLVPSAELVIGGLATNALGALSFSGSWPSAAAGLQLWTQAWSLDPTASQGFGASNGLRATGQ